MNGYERMMAAISGRTVDRPPVWPFVMTFAAKYAGVPYGEFSTDCRQMAKALIRITEDFDLDCITVDSDAYREATACGAILDFPVDDLPHVKKYAITAPGKFNFVQPRIEDCERLVDKIEGVRLVKEYFKNDKAVSGWIEAPLQCAGTLYNMQDYMSDIYENPEFIEELLAFITQLDIRFAREQIRAGADIIGIGDAMASLVSPSIYEKYFLPYTKEAVREIKRGNNVKLKYHICGNATHLLKYAEEIGFDIVNIDHPVNFSEAIQLVHGNIAIKGNVDPVVLLNSTPQHIYEEVQKLLNLHYPRFILSPGCEVGRDTPIENFAVFLNSAKKQ